MDVSIIIVNYNTCQMTSECIDSIIQKTVGISYEIILVDNASTDDSKEFFQQDSRVRYIYNNENLGFGRANNIGVNFAIGRNILFLNSDTLLVNNAIKILSDYLDENEFVGAVGGNLYAKNMMPVHSFRRFTPIFFDLSILLVDIPARIIFGKNKEHNFTDHVIVVNTIVGADLMIKKNVLDIVGLFDSRFFMYCEETELCHRIRKAHYRIVSVPLAKIIHLEGASFPDGKRIERMKMNRNNLKLYCMIHYGHIYTVFINLIWKMTVLSRIVYYSIINSPKKEFWKQVKKNVK